MEHAPSSPRFTPARVLQLLFAASLVAPLTLTGALAASKPAYRYLFAALGGALVIGPGLISLLARHGRGANLFLALSVLNVLVLTPELVLRARDFRYQSGIQFAYPHGFWALQPDPELFWRLPPSRPGVNSLGFPGPEIEIPKPPGVFRLLVLGDSVPMQGYPALVEQLLVRAEPRRRVDVANLAMAGYTSHQGRVLATKYGAELAPDLVLVSYGWNDHWLAWGRVDAEKRIDPNPPLARRLAGAVYQRCRLLQWIRARLVPVLGAEEPLAEVRVPLAAYTDNLVAIGRAFLERQTPVILLTVPTAHERIGVPDYLVALRFARRKEDVLTLHRAYNDEVRKVTAATGAALLDLDRELGARPDLTTLFTGDGIHLTPRGSKVVAEQIARFIRDAGYLGQAPRT